MIGGEHLTKYMMMQAEIDELTAQLARANAELENEAQRWETIDQELIAMGDDLNDGTDFAVLRALEQLTRANAVIERVAALHVPTQSLVWESYATPRPLTTIGGTMATTGGAAARQVVRTFCSQCYRAFPCPTRTILEGGDNE